MGFLLGMVLAGVGGLSAKTLNTAMSRSRAESKKIEKYWFETGLGFNEVTSLISNTKCYSSDKYYQACLNSVVQNALQYSLKISDSGLSLVKTNPSEHLEEKSEKELTSAFLKNRPKVDFDQSIKTLSLLETEERRPVLASKFINAFMSVYFDPHTYILPAHFYEEVGSKIERSRFFVGLSYEKNNGNYFIRGLSKNSDAELAGLKLNDQILKINSFKINDLKYSEVSQLLHDENAKELNFEVIRNGKNLEIELKRSYRVLSYVQYNSLQADKKYGLLTLAKFNRGACAEVAKALVKAQNEKVSGLVLDLRDNPGGQLDEAACIEGLFLGENKKAYYVEYFDISKPNEVALTSEKQMYKGPLVVLVNSMSASASELLSGSLQDYRRALIMGERTFGKGTFQEAEEWVVNPNVSLFKTQGLYLLPSRNSTQVLGITPDVEIKSDAESKREAELFLNPIPPYWAHYDKLKNSEIEENFIFSRCVSGIKMKTDDLALKEGLNYLNCVQPGLASVQSDVNSL
jgi:carboxyl-terminal processing protease